MTKKKIEIEVDTISLSDCTGKDIIEQIQNLESTYEKHGGVFFQERTKYYDYSEDSYDYMAVCIKREETDQEYQSRLTTEKQVEQQRLEHKRVEYEKLKALFEGNKQ